MTSSAPSLLLVDVSSLTRVLPSTPLSAASRSSASPTLSAVSSSLTAFHDAVASEDPSMVLYLLPWASTSDALDEALFTLRSLGAWFLVLEKETVAEAAVRLASTAPQPVTGIVTDDVSLALIPSLPWIPPQGFSFPRGTADMVAADMDRAAADSEVFVEWGEAAAALVLTRQDLADKIYNVPDYLLEPLIICFGYHLEPSTTHAILHGLTNKPDPSVAEVAGALLTILPSPQADLEHALQSRFPEISGIEAALDHLRHRTSPDPLATLPPMPIERVRTGRMAGATFALLSAQTINFFPLPNAPDVAAFEPFFSCMIALFDIDRATLATPTTTSPITVSPTFRDLVARVCPMKTSALADSPMGFAKLAAGRLLPEYIPPGSAHRTLGLSRETRLTILASAVLGGGSEAHSRELALALAAIPPDLVIPMALASYVLQHDSLDAITVDALIVMFSLLAELGPVVLRPSRSTARPSTVHTVAPATTSLAHTMRSLSSPVRDMALLCGFEDASTPLALQSGLWLPPPSHLMHAPLLQFLLDRFALQPISAAVDEICQDAVSDSLSFEVADHGRFVVNASLVPQLHANIVFRMTTLRKALLHAIPAGPARDRFRDEILRLEEPGLFAAVDSAALDEAPHAFDALPERPPLPLSLDRLPVDEYRQEIVTHVRDHVLTVIQGDTGCGKSSRVPQFILDSLDPDLDDPCIVVTQPRRIAAVSLAQRVAEERGCRVGEEVGYCIGHERVSNRDSKLLYVTSGWLLQKLVHNPQWLLKLSHVVLDEIHERDVDNDLLAVVIKRLVSNARRNGDPQVPKIVIMSATFDAEQFAEYFASGHMYQPPSSPDSSDYSSDDEFIYEPVAKPPRKQASRTPQATEFDVPRVIHVGVHRFPVEEYFFDDFARCPLLRTVPKAFPHQKLMAAATSDERSFERGPDQKLNDLRMKLAAQICYDIVCANANSQADHGVCVLVFVAGMSDIDDVMECLDGLSVGANNPMAAHSQPLMLHSLVSGEEQMRVYEPIPQGVTRIVVATNIAESSLTLPHVLYCIDTGSHKQISFSAEFNCSVLSRQWVSRASAKQRSGRTGRVAPGTVFRLYSRSLYDNFLPPYDTPEIRRVALDSTVLRLKATEASAEKALAGMAGSENPLANPRDVLNETMDPPKRRVVDDAYDVLFEIGALEQEGGDTDTDDDDDDAANKPISITPLGHFLVSVPVDVTLGRLIATGALFGPTTMVQCVVLVASLSMQGVFIRPHPRASRSASQFTELVSQITSSRMGFDRGLFSDMLVPLSVLRAYFQQPSSGRGQWCYRHGLNNSHVRSLASLCRQIASRILPLMPTRFHGALNQLIQPPRGPYAEASELRSNPQSQASISTLLRSFGELALGVARHTRGTKESDADFARRFASHATRLGLASPPLSVTSELWQETVQWMNERAVASALSAGVPLPVRLPLKPITDDVMQYGTMVKQWTVELSPQLAPDQLVHSLDVLAEETSLFKLQLSMLLCRPGSLLSGHFKVSLKNKKQVVPSEANCDPLRSLHVKKLSWPWRSEEVLQQSATFSFLKDQISKMWFTSSKKRAKNRQGAVIEFQYSHHQLRQKRELAASIAPHSRDLPPEPPRTGDWRTADFNSALAAYPVPLCTLLALTHRRKISIHSNAPEYAAADSSPEALQVKGKLGMPLVEAWDTLSTHLALKMHPKNVKWGSAPVQVDALSLLNFARPSGMPGAPSIKQPVFAAAGFFRRYNTLHVAERMLLLPTDADKKRYALHLLLLLGFTHSVTSHFLHHHLEDKLETPEYVTFADLFEVLQTAYGMDGKVLNSDEFLVRKLASSATLVAQLRLDLHNAVHDFEPSMEEASVPFFGDRVEELWAVLHE